jgi:hypothetical protein
MTVRVMERIEPILIHGRSDLVIVRGDVNSTLAPTLVADELLSRSPICGPACAPSIPPCQGDQPHRRQRVLPIRLPSLGGGASKVLGRERGARRRSSVIDQLVVFTSGVHTRRG